jgi:hypothetical protein
VSIRPKKMSREQLEEHGLVLAIQAAHMAVMEKKEGKTETHDSHNHNSGSASYFADSEFNGSADSGAALSLGHSYAAPFQFTAQQGMASGDKLSVGIFMLGGFVTIIEIGGVNVHPCSYQYLLSDMLCGKHYDSHATSLDGYEQNTR